MGEVTIKMPYNIPTEEYFKNNNMAIDIVNAKYAHTKSNGEKENISEIFWRVASGLAVYENESNKWANIWFNDMMDGWYRPGGSIIDGIGNTNKVSTANCTTIALKGDSIKDINNTMQEMMLCAAYRQGLGVDGSKLRPKGSKINNAAKYSEGVVPWMDYLQSMGDYVGQSGRRPACLISLKVEHPDIIEFIRCKLDLNKINNANISVQVSDKFMEAVKNDEQWEMYFEVETGEKVTKTFPAKEIFNIISECNYLSAEPGVQFIDKVHEVSMTHVGYKVTGDERYNVISTNACIPGFSRIITKNGIRELDEVSIGDDIWDGEKWVNISNKWSNGFKDVYEYKTTAGTFIGTGDHKIFSQGNKLYVGEAESIDIISGEVKDSTIIPEIVMDGLVIGDGSYHKCSNDLIILYIGENDYDYFYSEIKDFITKNRTKVFKTGWEIKTSITPSELKRTYERDIPDRFYKGNYDEVCSFLRGLFSANGSIVGDSRITLKQTSYSIIQKVQEMLSFVGIPSYITTNKSRENKFSNGIYVLKESYDINITKNKDVFYRNIGFIQKYKMDKLKVLIEKYNKNYPYKSTFEIKDIKYLGNMEVFDITVDSKEHCFWNCGCKVSNCSEKFLPDAGTCVLGSMNIGIFPHNNYTDILKEKAYNLARLLDNAITYEHDHELSPIEKQKWITKQTREIGCGITNIHKWLMDQDLQYDSNEGIDKIEEFMKNYTLSVFEASLKIGEEKGCAPIFNEIDHFDLCENSKFYNRCANEVDVNNRKLRNSALMSIAPSGSISMTFPEAVISTGCEPMIGAAYWRKTRAIRHSEYDYYFIFPKQVKEYILKKIDEQQYKEDYDFIKDVDESILDNSGKVGIKVLDIIEKYTGSDFFKPAHEIDPFQKIKLLSGLYKWIDAAVSCTFNLPRDTTVDTIENIYMNAWENDIRAVSVYREGSREGILIFTPPGTELDYINKSFCEERPSNIKFTCSPKRNEIMSCDIHRCKVKGNTWIVLVGIYNGYPYEIFAGEYNKDEMYIPVKVNKGKIKKYGNGKYSLIIDIKNSEVEYKDIAELFMNTEYKALTRMISLSLRHGVRPVFIIDQLKKSNEGLTDFSSVVARVLNKYMKSLDYDYLSNSNKTECEYCGGKEWVYQGGCQVCANCGKGSKCD